MFYPVDSLKRGGRFYLCWLADSWPDRFATITQRQLWSHDIRKICDDLMKVMTNESGRPVNRFSLRLSSQLMRGLVRVYQRKVNLYLADLCMINASVFKHTNKKWHIIEKHEVERLQQPLLRIEQVQELPEEAQVENEQQVTQLIQNSGNVVANVQDITLKESVIPDIQLPPNDDFGEENPDQALRLALGWPVEAMLGAESAPHVSALSAALEFSDPDLSRILNATQHMEPAAELDVTLFNKSVGPELAAREFDKDVPEIPEIPIPEISVPVPQAEKPSPERPSAAPKIIEEQVENAQKVPDTPSEIELQELEEIPAKRRRKHKLIVDKTKKIDPKVLQARMKNPKLELRCEDATDDVIEIRIPVEIYFRRLAHAGCKFRNNITNELNRLFLRNLGVIPNRQADERDMEELRAQLAHRHFDRSVLERIEEETVIHDKTQHQPVEQQIDQPIQMDTTKDATYVVEAMQVEQEIPDLRVSMHRERNSQVDISDLPTQKLEVSQGEKRKSGADDSTRKRLRGSSYKSFSVSQRRMEIDIAEAEKENVPANQQSPTKSPEKSQRNVLSMLEQAGIVDVRDVPETRQTDTVVEPSRNEAFKRNSEGSETPLGSLDRTKVSLGDSDKTTDSIRFIREQWGTVGTMYKIMKAITSPAPVTVWRLISEGPTLQGMIHLAAARCFNSILKLKQHGFIIIRKDPDTLEIKNIILGPRFD